MTADVNASNSPEGRFQALLAIHRESQPATDSRLRPRRARALGKCASDYIASHPGRFRWELHEIAMVAKTATTSGLMGVSTELKAFLERWRRSNLEQISIVTSDLGAICNAIALEGQDHSIRRSELDRAHQCQHGLSAARRECRADGAVARGERCAG